MKFAVFSPVYNDYNGGSIALHKLCSMLCEARHDAGMVALVKGQVIPPGKSYPCPFNIRLLGKKDVEDRIAIYPEVVPGNPLGSRHVVRWFLHRPGFHSGQVKYGERELYFFYKPEFNDPELNPHPENLLKLVDFKEEIYRNEGNSSRRGFCYLVRKGKNRDHLYHPKGSIDISNLTHHQIARVLNNSEFFISYDEHTMFLRFAVMCGCHAIIAPYPGVSREQWLQNNRRRNGIAYGYDDLEWAKQTEPLMLEEMRQEVSEMEGHVRRFADKCQNFFGLS